MNRVLFFYLPLFRRSMSGERRLPCLFCQDFSEIHALIGVILPSREARSIFSPAAIPPLAACSAASFPKASARYCLRGLAQVIVVRRSSSSHRLMANRSARSFCRPGLSSLLRAFRTASWTMRYICSEKNIVRRRPHAEIFHGVPSGPSPLPLKRKTSAAAVRLPSQERNPRASNQGPMESARHGTGRCISIVIFTASDRNSIQLFIKKETAVSGQTTEKRDR